MNVFHGLFYAYRLHRVWTVIQHGARHETVKIFGLACLALLLSVECEAQGFDWRRPTEVERWMLSQKPYLDPKIVQRVIALLAVVKQAMPGSAVRSEQELVALGPAALAPLDLLRSDRDARRLMSRFGPAAIPELLRLGAQDVLAELGPSSIPAIVDAWERKDPASPTPFVALSAYGRAATPALIRLLTHPNPEMRVSAAELFALHPDPDAADALVRGLGDESPGVRIQSARSLEALGDRRVLPYVVPWLDDPAPIVREEALAALGVMYERRFRTYLAHAARWDANLHVRTVAAAVLSRVNSPVERRLSKRYKPLTFDPAQELAAAAGKSFFFLLTIGAFLIISVPLGFRMRTSGALITNETSVMWAGLVLLGGYWGFGVNHTSGREELICCLLLIPLATCLGTGFGWAARGDASLHGWGLIGLASAALAAAWVGYGIGQAALWGYFGF